MSQMEEPGRKAAGATSVSDTAQAGASSANSAKTSLRQVALKDNQRHPTDTGSPEAQISILTQRINHLTSHFKLHPHDNHSRRGLLKMVSLRRQLLDYVKRKDQQTYQKILEKNNLRR